MQRQTIASLARGNTFIIAPAPASSGIVVNGIRAHPSKIIHYDHRIDIRDNANVALIIEHPVAMATIFGIHDAAITGCRETWDFYRAADREASARNLTPASVLGLADGSIGSDIATQLESAKMTITDVPLDLYTVAGPVSLQVDGRNSVAIQPAKPGELVLDISVKLFDLGPVHAILDPAKGLIDDAGSADFRSRVARARTSAVIGLGEEALLHALGDVAGDIAGTGLIRCGKVEATLGMAYHKATIGLVRHVHVNNWLKKVQ
nr:hypothetical protein [Candidatus Sigynarchaeota archaeon]